MSQIKNSVTHAYNSDWQDKLIDPQRLNSQRRVSYAINKLFTEIIRSPFAGDVLDLGCGDGMLVKVLNESGAVSAKGIDINHGINFETDQMPFSDDAFNIAIMYSVIEHIHNPGNIMTELRRILKKNGYLVIITSNFDLGNFYICDRKFYDDPTHVHPYNLKSLIHLMRLYSFSKIFNRPFLQGLYSRTFLFLRYPVTKGHELDLAANCLINFFWFFIL